MRFGKAAPVIDRVDCEFRGGEISALLGPSGCGKTTLLRTLAGLQPPTAGCIQSTGGQPSLEDQIAFVFQQPTLLPWRTALENVLVPLQLRRSTLSSHARRELAVQELTLMGLDSAAMTRYPRELSGGMRMRVSLARALVTRPQVFLLDEPFAALDDMLRVTLGDLILSRWRAQAFTVVLVTHNIAEAAMLSHRILVMRDGRIATQLDNPLPWPRDESVRTSPAFGAFYREVSAALRAHDQTS